MRRNMPGTCPGIVAFVLGKFPMSEQQLYAKSVITVSEMADLCQLSRSRFYDLLESGVFPKPVQHPSSKRPMYDRGLQEKCLEIRQTGIGMSGQPVLFNRKTRAGQKPLRRPAQEKMPDHADLLVALKGLGLVTTAQAVQEAMSALFPTGHVGMDEGDVVRKVFLHLQGKKK
jgi:hypothetical protein